MKDIWILGVNVFVMLILIVLISTGACDSTDEYIKSESSLRVVYVNGDIDTITVNYSSKSGREAPFKLYQDTGSLLRNGTCPTPSIVVEQLPLAPPHIVATNVRSFKILHTTKIE